MSEQKHYTARQFAEMVGVHLKTLQRWDRMGLFKSRRSPSNRRYYTHEDYERYLEGGVKSATELENQGPRE